VKKTILVRQRQAVGCVRQTQGISERRMCRVMEQSRSSQRYKSQLPERGKALIEQVIRLTEQYDSCGYRKTSAMSKNKS